MTLDIQGHLLRFGNYLDPKKHTDQTPETPQEVMVPGCLGWHEITSQILGFCHGADPTHEGMGSKKSPMVAVRGWNPTHDGSMWLVYLPTFGLAKLEYFTNLDFPEIRDFPSLATFEGPRSCEVAIVGRPNGTQVPAQTSMLHAKAEILHHMYETL